MEIFWGKKGERGNDKDKDSYPRKGKKGKGCDVTLQEERQLRVFRKVTVIQSCEWDEPAKKETEEKRSFRVKINRRFCPLREKSPVYIEGKRLDRVIDLSCESFIRRKKNLVRDYSCQRQERLLPPGKIIKDSYETISRVEGEDCQI